VHNNIKKIHDYIVNNARYDINKIDNLNDVTYDSNTAYGTLFQGYAVCSGYADTMALFLDKMELPNIKVANDKHVWNLVYIDNKWYHLDLTWDDPVIDNGEQILSHAFFLIDNNQLQHYNTGEHSINYTIYPEAE
jgi:transglutaminase/protease-like cytokinesis protein 3